MYFVKMNVTCFARNVLIILKKGMQCLFVAV